MGGNNERSLLLARITVDFFSQALMRTTTLDVILPVDNVGDAMGRDYDLRHNKSKDEAAPYPRRTGPFKTLFLLHGITGNHTDFISETRIRALAEEHNLAVIMPSGYNAFYLDQPESHNYYGSFVGEELVRMARSMFPLSTRREDTFIGGVSMGAYGALRNGLHYCENFGAIVALSSAMVVDGFDRIISDDLFFLSRLFLESTFGNLNNVMDSDKDPGRLAADLVYCDRPRPRVFMACGNQDPLVQANRYLADRMRGTGLEVDWREYPGGHDWHLWNQALTDAINWLPL